MAVAVGDATERGGWRDAWDRWGPLAGILFVAMIVAGVIVQSGSPNADDPARKVATYYVKHRSSQLTYDYLQILSTIPFILFAVSAWNRLRRVHGADVWSVLALIGGTLLVAFVVIQATIDAALAYTIARHAAADVAWSIYQVEIRMYSLLTMAAGLFLAGLCLSFLRSRQLPSWLVWLGLLGAVLGLIGTLGVANTSSLPGFLGFLGFVLFALFVLLASIFLVRRAAGGEGAASGATAY